jgi:diguanylate cyclase (GGDEF)-like protein
LAVALALWAVLMGFGQFRNPFIEVGGHLLGPIPQMLLGISMVMVLFENERNAVQENALALSTLGVDPSRVLDAKELVPSMTSILDRLVAPLPTRRAILYISERWRTVFPSVERGFSPELLEKLQAQGAGEYICELAYRRGGFIAFRNVADLAEPLPALPVSRFEHFKKVLSEDNIRHLTAVSVQTRENNFGVILFPHAERRMFGSSNLRLLIGLALQVGLTLENYVVMHDAHRRTRELAFLNNISKTAISSEDAEQMLAEIVSEIQQNFRFDHIGIGILDYVTKDIEIKAEAGTTAKARGKRVPLGVGILGRVARTGEMQLVQSTADGHLLGVLPESRAVLCIPIAYGETLLGVLNIESQRENAFSEQDRLILNTLADLLATALHNSFVFQKLQQQSITDGLTGIKTRRFFWEALTSEWKRASRSGRPFSVVLIDLDKFKEVNDTSGHLEGDLVLARVGRLLEQKCRQSNVVARYGGDEFIILMPETGIEQAQILAERLRLWVVTDPMLAEHHISGSFGVASFPVHGFSVEDIIRVADAGMYVAKHAGGNRVETAEEDLEGESAAVQRQLVSGYIEGFLQREHNGPEHVEELVATLKKLAGGEECNVHVLRDAIETVNRAAESREVQGSGHSELVARYAEVIGRALGLSPDDLTDLVFAARVHDIGKLFVAENILNKTGPLTDDEFYLMKRHARIGSEVIGIIPNGQRMQKAVEYHHESLDGAGYPAGLRGEQIPLWARILGLADAYANMTTERSFAPAKTSEQALAELEKFSGLRYDGMLVRLLIRQLKAEKAQSFGN